MADLKKIKLPNNTELDIRDSRVTGVDSSPASGSDHVITSGGVYTAIKDTGFFFVQGSSSAAGNGTSGEYLSTKWEGTITGITTPENGMKIAYRIATNAGVGTAGAVLSIDGGTTYKPVVFNVNSAISTRYGVGSTLLLTYNSTQTASAYLTSNKKTTVTGCWQIMDYSASNTDTKVRQYQSGDNAAGTSPEYPLLGRYAVTNVDGTYEANYARFHTGATLNTSTGAITATSFKKTNGTSSQFLKADGSVDSNTYLTSESEPAFTASAAHGISSSDITNWNGKQSALTFDSSPTASSTNPVTSGGVYTALSGKQATLTFDSTPTASSSNPVTSGGVYTALAGKQATLTFDSTPTSNSNNPVKSGGVYTALAAKEATANKVTSLSSSSNNTQYPSALCVYNLITGLTSFSYEVVASLPTASASTMGKIYIVSSTGVMNITTSSSNSYSWAQVGTLPTTITTISNGEIDALFE